MQNSKTPKEIIIAITYRCNARCQMCNTWQYPTQPEEEITPENLISLPRVDFCNITGGEPFIRQEEEIGEFVSLMTEKSRRIVISTNGYFTEKIVALAKKFPRLGIRISIEGLPATNDRLRGLENGFDKGVRTLMELQRLGLKDIGFGITLSDENILDLLGLYQLSKAMNLEFATAATHNSYYFHKLDNQITRIADFRQEIKKLIIELLKHRRIKNWFRAYFNYGLLNFVYGNKRLLPCSAGREFLFIDPLGNLMPCNGMEMSMGNIKEQKFREIWQGPRASEVRETALACQKQCWMIGSVAPAMKRSLAKPAFWVAKNKLRLMVGKEILT